MIILKKIVHSIDMVNSFLEKIAMWLIIPLVAVMLYESTMRYFFNLPTIWSMETALMIFGTYMIYAGPSSVRNKVQVGIDLFSTKWSRRTQAIVNSITFSFTTIFFVFLIKLSLYYALESWELQEHSTSAWGPPVYHWKMLIPIAMILTYLQTFADFLREFWMACSGEEL